MSDRPTLSYIITWVSFQWGFLIPAPEFSLSLFEWFCSSNAGIRKLHHHCWQSQGILLRPLCFHGRLDHMHLRMSSDSSIDHIVPLSFLDVSYLADLPLTGKEALCVEMTDLSVPICGQTGVSQALALSWVFSLWLNFSLGQYFEFLISS